ncbi:tetratricopeptide repeat protein [uncultured Bacteroides sp.]|uniref:tetratricopeptide repeat protein n=1 Tax=uncultured Bacteroides sp. TaxID=162156 RepID=UPI002AA899E1|nr:tetratricopeptide repeat protein [uncultured Bacteroides sp.]
MTPLYSSEQYINEQHQYIIDLLCEKRLKEALYILGQYLHNNTDWEIHNKLEQIQTSYSYMLQYMRQGIEDPERNKLYRKLLTNTMEIADKSWIENLVPISFSHYYRIKKDIEAFPHKSLKDIRLILETYTEELAVANLLPNTLNENAFHIRKQHEEALNLLFEETWVSEAWGVEEESEATMYLHSELIVENDLSLLVSAVTLSLLTYFDLKKMMWLFDAYSHTSTQVNQRALVGIAFILHLFAKRIELYPEVAARLTLLNENNLFSIDMNRLHIQWLLCQETEKIDKKMREEIIPEMLKSANLENLKYGIEETEEENDDKNPDWTNAMKESAFEDKLREMNDLQIEGADVYMSTFSQLKSYPFFRTMSNWFYPFDKQHSEVVKEFANKDQSNSIIDLILDSAFFCDSDKYSLCFTMMHLPQYQRDMMLSQLTEQQMEDFRDEQKASSLKKFSQQPETICNQYLHSLYRFFKIHPHKREFPAMFDGAILLHKNSLLTETLYKPQLLLKLGDFLFGKEHPAMAVNVYTDLTDLQGDSADLFQKIGYCRQKEKKYDLAIEAYLKADMIQPDNAWTNRHLATCYRLTKVYKKALEYYLKIETVQPESPNIIFYIGSCLAELERYEEALNYFFKLDFMETNCMKAWRAIGWCSFLTGKQKQAIKYYEKVIEKGPLWQDYLNAGHTLWSMGLIEKAIKMYSEALSECKDRDTFRRFLEKDIPSLIEQGINKDDIPLMLDII